ncbi:unnamed protein product [Calypogeia fissa]
MASIKARELHAEVQHIDCDTLAKKDSDQGPLLLLTLGIAEWSSIHHLARSISTESALGKLQEFVATLFALLEHDEEDVMEARKMSRQIDKVLNNDHNVPTPPDQDQNTPEKAAEVDIHTLVHSNPLMDLEFLSPKEQADLQDMIQNMEPADTEEVDGPHAGDTYIPIFPQRFVKHMVAPFDAMMWRIPNLNQLAPISMPMWQHWVNASVDELAECHDRAIRGVFESPLFPATAVTTLAWPMNIFKSPKYKCVELALIKVRQDYVTDSTRPANHKQNFWNWHRPYICCQCTHKSGCKGELLWFDHGIWYILNHLSEFFTAATSQGKLIQFMAFLTHIRGVVKDQITFMYLREFMRDACLELHNDLGMAVLLPQFGQAFGIHMIEKMVCPGSFLDDIIQDRNRNRWNLNDAPGPDEQRRGVFCNRAARGQAQGYGGRTNSNTRQHYACHPGYAQPPAGFPGPNPVRPNHHRGRPAPGQGRI